MCKIMVAGIGTDVGKTLVSAVITTAIQGDYWKPIQCGDKESSDTVLMKKLLNTKQHHIYKPQYSFSMPVSPHQAASCEKIPCRIEPFDPPQTTRPLIIEGVGGVLVPLTTQLLSLDLFKTWNCTWIIVSRHYIGSINHTLLTTKALKSLNIPIAGIIFNGIPHLQTEDVIVENTRLPVLGRLFPENNFTKHTIKKYAQLWQQNIAHLVH